MVIGPGVVGPTPPTSTLPLGGCVQRDVSTASTTGGPCDYGLFEGCTNSEKVWIVVSNNTDTFPRCSQSSNWRRRSWRDKKSHTKDPRSRSQIDGTPNSGKSIHMAIGRLTYRAHRQDRVPEYRQPMIRRYIRAKIRGMLV